jgi:hypothetical protein
MFAFVLEFVLVCRYDQTKKRPHTRVLTSGMPRGKRRADKVHAEYVGKAIDLDRAYYSTTAGSRPGPSEQRLIALVPGPLR